MKQQCLDIALRSCIVNPVTTYRISEHLEGTAAKPSCPSMPAVDSQWTQGNLRSGLS